MITSYKELLKKIESLEATDPEDKRIGKIRSLIRELLEPSVKNQRQIDFRIS